MSNWSSWWESWKMNHGTVLCNIFRWLWHTFVCQDRRRLCCQAWRLAVAGDAANQLWPTVLWRNFSKSILDRYGNPLRQWKATQSSFCPVLDKSIHFAALFNDMRTLSCWFLKWTVDHFSKLLGDKCTVSKCWKPSWDVIGGLWSFIFVSDLGEYYDTCLKLSTSELSWFWKAK